MRLGLDIGGTKIDAVLIDDEGSVVLDARVPTGYGRDEVLSQVHEAVRRIDAVGGRFFSASSIGVGIPGMVDTLSGRVRHSVNLGIDDLPFGELVSSLTGLPARVENDVNAATVGAAHVSHLTGTVGFLNLGTGMAAGIAVDGVLWRGAHGVTGEIGHLPIDSAAFRCACGQRGCLETIASGSAIARLWPTDAEHPARDLFDAADRGDEDARAVRAGLARGAAEAIRVLVLTVDIGAVVIGGGLSRLGQPLLADIRSVLEGWAAESPFIASLNISERIHLLDDSSNVAAIGAAMVGGHHAAALLEG